MPGGGLAWLVRRLLTLTRIRCVGHGPSRFWPGSALTTNGAFFPETARRGGGGEERETVCDGQTEGKEVK